MLTPTELLVAPGAPAAVGINGTPTSATDWVSISRAGSPPSERVSSKFLNSSDTPPATIVGPNPTVTFTAPTESGQYVYRYYKNNSLTLLAESAPFTVGINATLTLSVPSNVVPGEIITGTITNVLPTDTVTVERDTGVGSSVWTQEKTLVASPIISLRAIGPGRYPKAVCRDTTVMTSAEFIVKPAPTIAATGSRQEAGFPLTAHPRRLS